MLIDADSLMRARAIWADHEAASQRAPLRYIRPRDRVAQGVALGRALKTDPDAGLPGFLAVSLADYATVVRILDEWPDAPPVEQIARGVAVGRA